MKPNSILLAGNNEHWEKEIQQVPKVGEFYQSDLLCKLQESQSNRGRLSAHLVLSLYGWSVRYASGLQGFSLMHSSRSFDPREALEYGKEWTEADPNNRELFVSYFDIERCENKGHDCSELRSFSDK